MRISLPCVIRGADFLLGARAIKIVKNKSMNSKKLAVFDWNGTLLADTAIGWRATLHCLDFYGVPPISLKKQREIFDFPIVHFYERAGCDMDKVASTKEESNAIFQKHYDTLSLKARTRRGTRKLLDWLVKRDTTCIILSNYIENKLTSHLERLGLRNYFAYISANTCNGTSVFDQMNKYERLSDFMGKGGYNPANTVIFGDSTEEPDIAQRLGITSFGITGGCISDERLRATNPDHVITALPQAIDILKYKWKI